MKTQSLSADIQSTDKLQARMAANRDARRDFDEWCVRQFPEVPLPARILDLGAGTGKQVHLFSPLLSPNSEIFALDLERGSLEALNDAYNGPAHLHLLEGSFDELSGFSELEPESLDLIYSSYALYYTRDLETALRAAFDLLKPGGIFWLIAPFTGTNREFLEIIRPLYEVDPFMDYVFDEFHREVVAVAESQGFSRLKPSLLRNQVRFRDADAFLGYLSNSLFYQEGYDDEIRAAVDEICSHEGTFNVTKNVISLQLRK